MKKAQREHVEALGRIAASFGASIVDVVLNGHVKLRVRLKDGREINHSVCNTPSDIRSRLNDQSDFKRRLRELTSNG